MTEWKERKFRPVKADGGHSVVKVRERVIVNGVRLATPRQMLWQCQCGKTFSTVTGFDTIYNTHTRHKERAR